MGDEMHSRSAAATMLFEESLALPLLDLAADDLAGVKALYEAFQGNDYHFLRLSMAACKAACDAAHGIDGSTVVTAMTFSCQGFAIRVSGLGDTWFRGPHAQSPRRSCFQGHSEDEITWMGGESIITETAGLGGFAQAAALPLQRYQGGTAKAMIDRNLELYEITVGEHTEYPIPLFDYRGTPTGIDVEKVMATGDPARHGRRHPGPRRRADRRRLHPRADGVLPRRAGRRGVALGLRVSFGARLRN